MKKERYYKAFMLIITIFVIILLYSVFHIQYLKGEISESVQNYGLISIFVLPFFLEFVPQYISPHALLVVSSLLEFNLLLSTLIVIIGSTLGSIAGFEIGYRFKIKAKIIERIIGNKKSKKFEKGVNKFGKIFVALAAISPLPYIPLILGMIHLSRKNFFIYGVIPRVLGLGVFGFFGKLI